MKKPKKGKARRPRGPRKKSTGRRKSLRQHILFARRWCRSHGVSAERIRADLDQEPDAEGYWLIDADTGELEIDAKVRGALLGLLDSNGRL